MAVNSKSTIFETVSFTVKRLGYHELSPTEHLFTKKTTLLIIVGHSQIIND